MATSFVKTDSTKDDVKKGIAAAEDDIDGGSDSIIENIGTWIAAVGFLVALIRHIYRKIKGINDTEDLLKDLTAKAAHYQKVELHNQRQMQPLEQQNQQQQQIRGLLQHLQSLVPPAVNSP